jgi:hypothetical protein
MDYIYIYYTVHKQNPSNRSSACQLNLRVVEYTISWLLTFRNYLVYKPLHRRIQTGCISDYAYECSLLHKMFGYTTSSAFVLTPIFRPRHSSSG